MMVSDSRGESESVVDLVHRQGDNVVMSPVGLACAEPSRMYPEGRVGTTAGYAAHRSHGEMACEPCVAAWTMACAERERALPVEERERRKRAKNESGSRSRARQAAEAALKDACAAATNEHPAGRRGTAAGYAAHITAGQRPCKPCRHSPIEPGAACVRPTLRFPDGRTGTDAGYHAHRDAGESACGRCLAAFSSKSLARRHAMSDAEKARFRAENAAAHKRWRERDPEAAKAAKHRVIGRNRAAVRAAKGRPCTDCGVQYPYYVMEFDHLDADAKHFNVSAGVTCASHDRLLAEIAKCEVVCANCHAERTHQRKQTREGAQTDAVH